MRMYTLSQLIDSPVTETFRHVSDLATWPDWHPKVTAVKRRIGSRNRRGRHLRVEGQELRQPAGPADRVRGEHTGPLGPEFQSIQGRSPVQVHRHGGQDQGRPRGRDGPQGNLEAHTVADQHGGEGHPVRHGIRTPSPPGARAEQTLTSTSRMWRPRPYKRQNFHSLESINTENSDTHGRSVWVHSSRVGLLDNSVRPKGAGGGGSPRGRVWYATDGSKFRFRPPLG